MHALNPSNKNRAPALERRAARFMVEAGCGCENVGKEVGHTCEAFCVYVSDSGVTRFVSTDGRAFFFFPPSLSTHLTHGPQSPTHPLTNRSPASASALPPLPTTTTKAPPPPPPPPSTPPPTATYPPPPSTPRSTGWSTVSLPPPPAQKKGVIMIRLVLPPLLTRPPWGPLCVSVCWWMSTRARRGRGRGWW